MQFEMDREFREILLLLGLRGLSAWEEIANRLEALCRELPQPARGQADSVLETFSGPGSFEECWGLLGRLEPIVRMGVLRGALLEPDPVDEFGDEEPRDEPDGAQEVPDHSGPPRTQPESIVSAAAASPAPPVSARPPAVLEAVQPDHFSWTRPNLPSAVLADFFAEVAEHIDEVMTLLLTGDGPDDSALYDLYRKLHTIKGNSGMVGLGELQRVAHVMEDTVKEVREAERSLADVERALLADGVALLASILALAQDQGEGLVPVTAYTTRVASHLAGGGSPAGGPDSGCAPVPPAHVEVPSDSMPPVPEPMDKVSLPIAASAAPTAGPAGPRQTEATGTASEGPVAADRKAKEGRPASRMLRVDFGQVDRLASLVGEQAVKHEDVQRQLERMQEHIEGLGRHLDRAPSVDRRDADQYLKSEARHLGGLASDLDGITKQLSLVSSDIQRSVLSLRMVELESLFKKHQMTVFQTANAQGKKALLVIDAGETKLDKSIAEKLEEPLVHLIRNAVSHGIQTPEMRAAEGKPIEGTVTIRAYHQGSQVVIRVEDDGAGISPDILRLKAVQKGFLTQEESARLDDDRIVDLIFAAGFSTTAKADDISGRGVGLDVVRDKVNKLKGAIQVFSEKGKGTTFQLTLPLTLALAKVLLVQLGGEIVALPADAVARVEIVDHSAIAEVDGKYVVRLGEATTPFVFLSHELGLTPVAQGRGHYTVCVVSHGNQLGAFAVDRILEHTQAVIREVGPVLPHIAHCMGVTFHEGDCVLILDVGSVIRGWSEGRSKPTLRRPGRSIPIITTDFDGFAGLHRHARKSNLRFVLVEPVRATDEFLSDVSAVVVDGSLPNLEETLDGLDKRINGADLLVVEPPDRQTMLPLSELYRMGVVDLVNVRQGWGGFVRQVARYAGRGVSD